MDDREAAFLIWCMSLDPAKVEEERFGRNGPVDLASQTTHHRKDK